MTIDVQCEGLREMGNDIGGLQDEFADLVDTFDEHSADLGGARAPYRTPGDALLEFSAAWWRERLYLTLKLEQLATLITDAADAYESSDRCAADGLALSQSVETPPAVPIIGEPSLTG